MEGSFPFCHREKFHASMTVSQAFEWNEIECVTHKHNLQQQQHK